MLVLRRLVASLVVAGSLAGTAPSAFAQSEIDSYFEFLMARRLEGAGDFAGAQAALDRAVQATPRSAELRGQVASFHLRRSQPDEAEKAAPAARHPRWPPISKTPSSISSARPPRPRPAIWCCTSRSAGSTCAPTSRR